MLQGAVLRHTLAYLANKTQICSSYNLGFLPIKFQGNPCMGTFGTFPLDEVNYIIVQKQTTWIHKDA